MDDAIHLAKVIRKAEKDAKEDYANEKMIDDFDPISAFKRLCERIQNKDEQMLFDLQLVMLGLSKQKEAMEALQVVHRTVRNGDLILMGSAYERMIASALEPPTQEDSKDE